jgi:hypothetical protein
LLQLTAEAAQAVPPAADPTLKSAGGDAELSLGVRAEASAVRRGITGFLGLSVPLERLAAPRRLVVAEAEPPVPADVVVPAEVPPASPRPAEERPPGVRPLEASALSVLARGALAAARRADLTPERERALDGIASRARVSALLPEVRFRAARTRDETLRLTPTTDDPYRFSLAGGDAVVLEGAATFRLSRLLFADEELAVERLRLERERAWERRIARVLERVLAWHAALVRLSTAVDETEQTRWLLELEGATVELDVLTAGWFGARVEALGVLPTTPPAVSERAPAAEAARLEPPGLSAKPPGSCLPTHETGSRTFKGVSMR